MKKRGCLTWIIGFLIICFMIPFYVLAWIPAIGFIIYYLIKRDFSGKRKRNFIISIIVFVTSLLWFIWAANNTVALTGIQADWKSTKFDVSETTEVNITPVPSDATIRKLTLSDNDIAELDYEDGKATISFKKAGTAKLTFTANDSIDSNTTTITVTDKKAEEEAQKAKEEKERLAAEKAKKEEEEKAKKEEEEKAAKEKTEQEAKAKADAEAQAAAEAQKQAEADAAAKQAEQERIAAEQQTAAAQQPQTSSYVVNTNTGKFHSPSCRDVNKIKPENYWAYDGTRDDLINQGYSPCGHCNP